jgi:hypothetical protein
MWVRLPPRAPLFLFSLLVDASLLKLCLFCPLAQNFVRGSLEVVCFANRGDTVLSAARRQQSGLRMEPPRQFVISSVRVACLLLRNRGR